PLDSESAAFAKNGIDKVENTFNDSNAKKTSEFKEANLEQSSIYGDLAKAIDGIEKIADSHPIFKAAFLIISVGYKIYKYKIEEAQQLLDLAKGFEAGSKEFVRLLTLPTKSLNEDIRNHLVDAVNDFLDSLIAVAEGCLSLHGSVPTTLWSKMTGSTVDKLKEINSKLTDAASELSRVQQRENTWILVDIAGKVDTAVDKLTVLLSAGASENANADLAKKIADDIKNQLQSTADDTDRKLLREHIKYTDYRSLDEMRLLEGKRNPKTRGWIVDRTVESVSNLGSEKKIVWLRGAAGTGKSVISACVAAQLEVGGLLTASFFCQHGNKLKNNLSAMIQTLCYEVSKLKLAHKNAMYRKRLIFSLQDSNFKDKTNPSVPDLVGIFIAIPFQDWPLDVPCGIVLDALDELVDHASVSLVLDAFQSLKKPVKLFVTSRPDVEINLKGKRQYEIEIFDVDSQNNKDDIRIFTHDQLSEMFGSLEDVDVLGEDEFNGLVTNLAEAASGLFIWITLVLGNVEAFEMFEVSEKEALDVVEGVVGDSQLRKETAKQLLEKLQQSATLDLQSLYCRALSKAFVTADLVSDFKTCFGVVVQAQEPLSVDSIVQIIEKFPGGARLTKIGVKKTFNSLQSLLAVDKESKKLSFIHKTVYEYLKTIKCHSRCVATCSDTNSTTRVHCCHNKTASTFQIDFNDISFQMAISCLQILNDGLSENMARLDGSVKYSGQTFPDSLTPTLTYAVLYWSDHFIEAFAQSQENSPQKALLVKHLLQFCQEKLPMYLEALLLLGQLNKVVGVVTSVLRCLNLGAHDFIHKILTDLKFVAYNFRFQLLVSPLQVYRHALIAAPQNTLYYKTYKHLTFTSACLTIGTELECGPSTLTGHTYPLTSVAHYDDGKFIVSGSYDMTVKIWDTETGECLHTLVGHTLAVTSVAVSSDGRFVVSGSYDKTVKVWDREVGFGKGQEQTLVGHTDAVNSVAVSSDGRFVVSGSNDKTVKVWDREVGFGKGQEQTLVGHTNDVTSVAVSSDGRFVVSGSYDKTVKVWDREVGFGKGQEQTLVGHSGSVNSVAVSSDGRFVVSGSDDKTVKVWDREVGFGKGQEQTLVGHSNYVTSVAVSSDGRFVVSLSQSLPEMLIGSGSIQVWDKEADFGCIQELDAEISSFESVVATYILPVPHVLEDNWIVWTNGNNQKELIYMLLNGSYVRSGAATIAWAVNNNVVALCLNV
ncbi:UNVERIFIED_CONTAM: hypothetical protein HDU68_003381, partial [Siphonaria sp. JEL0065]